MYQVADLDASLVLDKSYVYVMENRTGQVLHIYGRLRVGLVNSDEERR